MSGSSGGKTSKLYSYYNNASANFTLTLTTGLGTSDSDWHHYAIVYGYTGTTYTANLYVDGEFSNSTTATSTNVAQTGSLKLTVATTIHSSEVVSTNFLCSSLLLPKSKFIQ